MTKSLRTGEDKTMKRKILNIIKIVVLLSVFFGILNISNTTFATDANQTLEDIRDKAIDEQLEQIKTTAPELAIIEV